MDASHRTSFQMVVLLALVYLVIGIVFGSLAGYSTSDSVRTFWRLAAWLASVAAFTADVWYQHFRIRSSRRATAIHAALAAAFGAFGLAVSANIHAQLTASSHKTLLTLSLVIWPIVTGVPAFVVAFVVVTALVQWRRNL